MDENARERARNHEGRDRPNGGPWGGRLRPGAPRRHVPRRGARRGQAVLLLAALAVMALVAAACSSTPSTTTTAARTTTTTSGSTTTSTAGSSGSGAKSTARIVIANFRFTPDVITVSPGETIVVVNEDQPIHTLTSLTGKFNTGDIDPGSSATIKAPTQVGTYPYDCTIHTFMHGTIIVS